MDIEKLSAQYHISDIVPLKKGWSRDEKYILTDTSGTKFILRVSDPSLLSKKQEQFQRLQKLETFQLPASKPIAIGTFEDGRCYMLLSYLEGEDGLDAVQKLNDREAYDLGLEAGSVLRKLHAVPTPPDDRSWWDKIQAKMQRKIDTLQACDMRLPMQEQIIAYYLDHTFLMKDRPQVLCHSDYHLGNMVVQNGKIGIIDFDKCCIADPYDDFKPFCWNVMQSEYFETGMINGYFEDQVPDDFFPILKYYSAEAMISHLPWAVPFGEQEIAIVNEVNTYMIQWWGEFKRDVPTWYKGIL